MKRLFIQFAKSEKGLSLPIILIVLLIGGLLIAPSLNYAGTSLRSVRSEESIVKGIFAADAGIEDVLWYLKSTPLPTPLPTSLPQNINGLSVTPISTEDKGNWVLYNGIYMDIKEGTHTEWVTITKTIVWDAGANAYKYTVTITKNPNPVDPPPKNIKIKNVGAKLPLGYIYKTGSAASFPSNLSPTDSTLTDKLDSDGAHLVNWSCDNVELGLVRTQEFYVTYVTGTGEIENCYAWAQALSNDIGYISEMNGHFYQITAWAKEGTTTIASITADVMKNASGVYITSWRIN
jgi:hypothetical protein